LLERATFVVGHGGHGTTMRAVRYGRPLVGIPALALDQVPITQLFDAWGIGRGLPPDADTDQIRAAAEDILNDPLHHRSQTALDQPRRTRRRAPGSRLCGGTTRPAPPRLIQTTERSVHAAAANRRHNLLANIG
jgi:hypothetical protein